MKLETIEQRASYGIGRQMGDQLAQNGFKGVDIEAAAFGLKASFNGEELHVNPEDLQEAFNELTKRLREEQEKMAEEQAAAAAAEPNTEAAVTGWQAVTAALSDYASKAREIGGDIGQSLVSAFQSAENAVGDFVKTGKLDFRDLVTSLLAAR